MNPPPRASILALALSLAAASCAHDHRARSPGAPLPDLGAIQVAVDTPATIAPEARDICVASVSRALRDRGFTVEGESEVQVRVEVLFLRFQADYQAPPEAISPRVDAVTPGSTFDHPMPTSAELTGTLVRDGHTQTFRAAADGQPEQGPRDLRSADGRAQAFACSLAAERLAGELAGAVAKR